MYEYRIEFFNHGIYRKLDEEAEIIVGIANNMSLDGWEFFNSSTTTENVEFLYFRRPKNPEPILPFATVAYHIPEMVKN